MLNEVLLPQTILYGTQKSEETIANLKKKEIHEVTLRLHYYKRSVQSVGSYNLRRLWSSS